MLGPPAATAAPTSSPASGSRSSSLLSAACDQYDDAAPYSSVRRYKTLTLTNSIQVLLVSDRTALQASAAVTVNGAGQFSDPSYLHGLAHLMEHIVLSSTAGGGSWSNQGDFREWIDGDYAEGFSNGFTAYEKVCFHFSCGTDAFGEALQRFSNLLLDKVVSRTCQNPVAVQREILRVNSELDKANLFSRELYLTKSLINPRHPYSKVTPGSLESLKTVPEIVGINVPRRGRRGPAGTADGPAFVDVVVCFGVFVRVCS